MVFKEHPLNDLNVDQSRLPARGDDPRSLVKHLEGPQHDLRTLLPMGQWKPPQQDCPCADFGGQTRFVTVFPPEELEQQQQHGTRQSSCSPESCSERKEEPLKKSNRKIDVDVKKHRFVCSGLTDAGDSSYDLVVTESDLHFPPMAVDSQVSSGSAEQSDTASPGLTRTFAQVLSQDCRDECECMTDLALDDDDDDSDDDYDTSSGESSGPEYVDKSDARYPSHLEFAIRCGYSESDLDQVIARRGLGCDKNLLLEELLQSCAVFQDVEEDSPDGVTTGGDNDDGDVNDDDDDDDDNAAKSTSDDMGIAEVPLDTDSEQSADGVEEVLKEDQKAEDQRAEDNDDDNLRYIIIDGSNVAMSHGKSGVFSCRGIQLVVDWFRRRGHQDITVFVPQWRKEKPCSETPMTDQDTLLKLEEENVVVFTPSRRVKGRRVICYDDRYVLALAAQTDGVVVSNDSYRDLMNESDDFKDVVNERLLMYAFVNNRFMPPEDPLGRRGPTLDNFLRKQPAGGSRTSHTPCPYGRKCSFGHMCKYSHPERGSACHRMVSEVLKEQASRIMQKKKEVGNAQREPKVAKPARHNSKLKRTRSVVRGQPVPGQPSSSAPSSQRPEVAGAADATADSPSKSLPKSASGKTSDYLSEHRKKLERDLAMAQPADPRTTCGNAGRPSEGHLVTGHHLPSKKLSDEAPVSGLFSQEGLARPQGRKASFGMQHIDHPQSRQDQNRSHRSSVPDHHRYRHQHRLSEQVPAKPQYENSEVDSYVLEAFHSVVNGLLAFPFNPMTAVPASERQQSNCSPTQMISMDRCHQYGGLTSSAGTNPGNCFSDAGGSMFNPNFPPPPILHYAPDRSTPPHGCPQYGGQGDMGQHQYHAQWQPGNTDASRPPRHCQTFLHPHGPHPHHLSPPPPPPPPSTSLHPPLSPPSPMLQNNVASFGQGPSPRGWLAAVSSPPPPPIATPPINNFHTRTIATTEKTHNYTPNTLQHNQATYNKLRYI